MIRRAAQMESEVREEMRGGKGRVTIQHFFKKNEIRAKSRLCAKLVLPPGASIGPHEHQAEDEVYMVVRGTGVLDDGTRREPIAAGDAVLTGNGETHALINDGPGDLEVIAVIMTYA
ncbi:MAG: cupin domain-containing protein [Kiritimatiellae bacterium]|nr:cupin domain-containing protein [Kiritimatiellia bacterium]